MIKVAFATGMEGEFGLDGGFPWKRMFKHDMKHFKSFTTDTALVMGVKTYQSLPSRLRGLEHIVISANTPHELIVTKSGERPTTIANPEDLVEFLSTYYADKDICVIGGKSLIEAVLPIADEVLHTVIYKFEEDDSNSDPVDFVDMDCDVKIDRLYHDYTTEHINCGGNYLFEYCKYGKVDDKISFGVCVHIFKTDKDMSHAYFDMDVNILTANV